MKFNISIITFVSAIYLIIIHPFNGIAQYDKTANDFVPSYNNLFTFGTNGGYPSNGKWTDEDLSNLAAGNASITIPGAGCNGLRVSLPEHFLEKWGYEIRVNTFQHYADLGMFDLTAFIGYPSDAHKDNTSYCSTGQSEMFANMYEPIWDNNANGTPVNDNNYLALYVYKMVSNYGDKVKFWEIWNEPDYTSTDLGWKDQSYADNWWIRNPKPEELDNLLAPIFHYIRALHVCYEVIKSIDENDFVCVGGIGYSSFLDAVLRNTDNPSDGSVSSAYPLKGGAYFDCVSYHNYPMYSLRKWENGAWVPLRYSDKAIEVVINSKSNFENVLSSYGYNGTTYPEKEFIITETNVPSISVNDYIGSNDAQKNYLMKIIVAAQKANIKSLHSFSLYDGKVSSAATSPYHSMGFYLNLDNILPYNQQEKPSAVASRTAMNLLRGTEYNETRTGELNLPANIDGAAFKYGYDVYVYALWAKTSQDNNENATAQYTFPAGLNITSYSQYEWNYSSNNQIITGTSSTVQLTGSPSFFTVNGYALGIDNKQETTDIQAYPNPVKDKLYINTDKNIQPTVILQNIEGKQLFEKRTKTFPFEIDMTNYKQGIYILKIVKAGKAIEKKIIKL